jgi:hypothetical protein
VFFFDTPELALNAAAVVVRARRRQGEDGDTVSSSDRSYGAQVLRERQQVATVGWSRGGRKGRGMTIGPGTAHRHRVRQARFQGRDDRKDSSGCGRATAVRVIDALVVYKDAEGELAVLKGSQLSKDEAKEFGAAVGGLIGR